MTSEFKSALIRPIVKSEVADDMGFRYYRSMHIAHRTSTNDYFFFLFAGKIGTTALIRRGTRQTHAFSFALSCGLPHYANLHNNALCHGVSCVDRLTHATLALVVSFKASTSIILGKSSYSLPSMPSRIL